MNPKQACRILFALLLICIVQIGLRLDHLYISEVCIENNECLKICQNSQLKSYRHFNSTG